MKRKNSLLLATLVSLALLSGCGDDTIEVDGVKYKKSGEEYVEMTDREIGYETITQIFEPGTHYVEYFNNSDRTNRNYTNTADYSPFGNESGFLESSVPYVEGYEVVSIYPVAYESGESSVTVGFVYVMVNTETVEVKIKHDFKTDQYLYTEPGIVVKEHGLS